MFKKKLLLYWPSFASVSSCSATLRSVDLAFVAFETILHVLPWSDRCLASRRAPALPNYWLLLVIFTCEHQALRETLKINVPVNFFLARGHAIFQGGRTKYSTLIYKSTLADCCFRPCRVFDLRPVSYLEHWKIYHFSVNCHIDKVVFATFFSTCVVYASTK